MATIDEKPLFIKDLIRKVHEELVEAQQEREEKGMTPLFKVDKLTIEAHFVAQTTSESSGGLEFRILTIGGGKGTKAKAYQEQEVHKISLDLTAVEPSSLGSNERDLPPETGIGDLPDLPRASSGGLRMPLGSSGGKASAKPEGLPPGALPHPSKLK